MERKKSFGNQLAMNQLYELNDAHPFCESVLFSYSSLCPGIIVCRSRCSIGIVQTAWCAGKVSFLLPNANSTLYIPRYVYMRLCSQVSFNALTVRIGGPLSHRRLTFKQPASFPLVSASDCLFMLNGLYDKGLNSREYQRRTAKCQHRRDTVV